MPIIQRQRKKDHKFKANSGNVSETLSGKNKAHVVRELA
jgi:hypothetical protein